MEEGRHLWAMVYLLHSYFGRDGREESEELLERRSGNADKPRILDAFNEPIDDWLSFFMFTTFTDRDGKYQLLALAESGFDPLVAHHALHAHRGGASHVRGRNRRAPRGAAHLRADARNRRRRRAAQGGIDLPTIQKYINFWFSLSLDLFGGEVSSNAADFFARA